MVVIIFKIWTSRKH